jgi:segregation and condensation protein B
MKRDLEALLFATEAPLPLPRLRALFPDASAAQIRGAIADLQVEYDQAGNAFTIVEFGGGWQVATRPEYAPLIQRLYGGRRQVRLSKAGLEVLAIIAYRQPITRLEIDDVRGVQSTGALTTLLERNLITVVGRAETVGHPILYGTTREFLNHLGLQGLNQLPPLPEAESLARGREEFKQFARQLGEELTDDDLRDWDAETEAPGALETDDADLPLIAEEADEAEQAAEADEAEQAGPATAPEGAGEASECGDGPPAPDEHP